MRVFVDTNVLIDFVCKREEFYQSAEIIFDLAYTKRVDVVISTLSFINAYYVGAKYKIPTGKLQATLLSIMSFTKVSTLDKEMVIKAFEAGVKDVEDVAQYGSALSMSSDCIVTRNKKDFSFSKLPVYTPADFIDKIM